MPDQTINYSTASLKHINTRLEKMDRLTQELETLAYRYHRLSYEINQIDVMAFEIRNDFLLLREALERAGFIRASL